MLPEAIAPLVTVIPGQVLIEAIVSQREHRSRHASGLTKVTQTAQ